MYRRQHISDFRIVLTFVVGLLFHFTMAQDIDEASAFNDVMHTVINDKPSSFEQLETLFKTYKRDSLKMKRLAATSSSISYTQGESYAFIHLGNIYRNISKYERAIDCHEKAEQLAVLGENISLQIISLNMLEINDSRTPFLKIS